MKEWYLLTQGTQPNSTGGYENESFNDFKGDAFSEALQTDIATTVTLYNHDLSESKDIRCIVQDNLSSTQLKSIERTILATIGTLKAGMYIYFENGYWLVSGYPGNNGMYEKATIILCQYKLKWQDDDGNIIERYANFTSASKYDTGTSGNQIIVLTSNNFTIWVPNDDISATLDGKRVFIDRNAKNLKKVFKITRSDDVLYLFGDNHGGILSFIADKDELNMSTDRPDLGLCDYHSPTPQPTPQPSIIIFATITGGNTLRCGRAKSWSVSFKDSAGVEVADCDFKWNVVSEFAIKQTIDTANKKIQLRVDDEAEISSSFLLQIIMSVDGVETIVAENKITVVQGL